MSKKRLSQASNATVAIKEFVFISTVKIAQDVHLKYPNYKINSFTPKTLAKRLVSDNSESGSMRDFGFSYKTTPLSSSSKLFIVQEVSTSSNEIKNSIIFLDRTAANAYALSRSKQIYKNLKDDAAVFEKCESYETIYAAALMHKEILPSFVVVNEATLLSSGGLRC